MNQGGNMNKIPATSKKNICFGMLITLATVSSTEASENKQRGTIHNEVGRYQIEPIFDGSERGHKIWPWVIDTKTGRVRVCSRDRYPDAPECSPWSNI